MVCIFAPLHLIKDSQTPVWWGLEYQKQIKLLIINCLYILLVSLYDLIFLMKFTDTKTFLYLICLNLEIWNFCKSHFLKFYLTLTNMIVNFPLQLMSGRDRAEKSAEAFREHKLVSFLFLNFFYTNGIYSNNCRAIRNRCFELWRITILCYRH